MAKWPRVRTVAQAVPLSIVLGVMDWITGPSFSFSIFHLVPVALVAWMLGRREAILLWFFGAVVWTVADVEPWWSTLPPILDLWNVAVRLGFFLLVTWALATTRRAPESQSTPVRRVQTELLRSRRPAVGPVEVATAWRPAQAVSGVPPQPEGARWMRSASLSSGFRGPRAASSRAVMRIALPPNARWRRVRRA